MPQPIRPSRGQLAALAIGLIATAAVAIVSLVVALSKYSATEATYSPAEREAAKTQLCERYKTAVRASRIETVVDGDPALARISMLNVALLLGTAAEAPALDVNYRDAARALAVSFQIQAALASSETADSPTWHQTVDDTNAKDRVLEGICGD